MNNDNPEPKPNPLKIPVKSIHNFQPDYRRIDELLKNPGADPEQGKDRRDAG